MKYVLILLLLSCNVSRKQPGKTYLLNGYKSYSPDGYLTAFKWRVISGNSIIHFPDSIATKIQVKNKSMIELKGIDNNGMEGRDTVILK